ncbi:MAG: methylmalonyl-CoA mutase family protein [Candidatus Riflebacteria bacterium]|nr:methylmalonyl-CoA mutase family protein [Candidatus Riflebacteria bacterium]
MTISYSSKNKIRIVTATALFDGHDVSINLMRRLLQSAGAEVIHLGHNRGVMEIVDAAVQEDVQAVAVSSYQGGHVEFFKFLRKALVERGRPDILIFGGGGGVILPHEAEELHNCGVTKIYSPEDARLMGLEGMIEDIIRKSDFSVNSWPKDYYENELSTSDVKRVSRALSMLELKNTDLPVSIIKQLERGRKSGASVLGVTGPGGAGKSSLVDEIIRRFLLEYPDRKYCVFSIDPSKKKTGGALLGDRIRMNSINHENVFTRSFATRGSSSELSDVVKDAVALVRKCGFDLIIVETSGIGQGDTGILDICDVSLYVMTSEYGAPMQLEKIDMLDYADVIAINKFDRRASEDAFRDVIRQVRRTRFEGKYLPDENYPVFGTIASKFNDDGVNALFRFIQSSLNRKNPSDNWQEKIQMKVSQKSSFVSPIIPQNRTNYLSEITETIRDYHRETSELKDVAEKVYSLDKISSISFGETTLEELKNARIAEYEKLPLKIQNSIESWSEFKSNYEGDTFKYTVRGKIFEVPTNTKSLAGSKIPRVSLPQFENYGDIITFLRKENVPGSFPFTAGVFPFKRSDEEPKRQFAGEGGPERTNKRFHFLTANDPAKRLSTAFDSVSLYGQDPEERMDVFGKIGESGVSISTLDDMKSLFRGFDLCDSNTSVSMTTNGPAPIMLAFFMNTAIDQQIDKAQKLKSSPLTEDEKKNIAAETLKIVRGTVQADILKEDQGQNTCVFSIDFALKMLGDIQEYFIRNEIRNYYSISISGYHIAEAGANPISQLAFTLANGFTFVEYYLSRGMKIDDFAPNLSFFFSNGMDPEYTVIGRVARRIWAIAMKKKYKANERSQKLKYHCQTSGRSLHAQEIQFNDIRTTLQALLAINDNCNSLHTNAYDEAITTPTEESVRRSMAVQMILNREYGFCKNENPLQGSYFVEYLTDMVEKAVLDEFDRISSRGGVLGAMETQYQREKIQEESMYYEMLKHSGELPIIGVNTYLNPNQNELGKKVEIELARATLPEKTERLERVNNYKKHNDQGAEKALEKLKSIILNNGNIFEELMNTAKVASVGQITSTLFSVGGQYRRNL